ncbi:zinc finger protein 583-like isoform X2 [Plodia interpunctella]|uniref:zinc finger protein 583-like isoform X2 n=1 Tax=Plodia interpunctella TaxID=58824 RepID=UPI002368165B|nr:zinc finger protein 583-like isoform X2 [Plodia interpunctella]
MSDSQNNNTVYCSFVSIHYIICECGETFPNEEDLKSHLESEHPHKIEKKEFSCGLCDEAFASEEAFISHHKANHTVKIVKPPSPPPVKYVIQPIKQEEEDSYDVYQSESPCINSVQQDFDVDKSMIVTSGKHPGVRKKYAKKNIKNKVCEVCGKKYASNAALRYHQRVHTGERPYQCSFCDKAFTMPLFLQIHHRIHTGEKPYQCPHCPKAFGNKAALLRHDRVHTGVKPYTCPQCYKTFTQSNSMKLHVHTVHLRLPAPYKSKRRKERMARPETDIVMRDPEDEVKEEWCPESDPAPRGPNRIAVPRSPIKISLPKGAARLVLPRDKILVNYDLVNTLVESGEVKRWTPEEQISISAS